MVDKLALTYYFFQRNTKIILHEFSDINLQVYLLNLGHTSYLLSLRFNTN